MNYVRQAKALCTKTGTIRYKTAYTRIHINERLAMSTRANFQNTRNPHSTRGSKM
jgi:hypothetical protein